jgi:glycerol kinase
VDVLAIDQGTSATKALVVSPEGQVRAEAEVAVSLRALPDGGVEQDPEELFDSIVTAGRRALELAPEPVGAVAVANQGEAVVGLDPRSGRATTAVVSWQDRRAAAVVEALEPAAARRLEEISGLPTDPYFTAAKLAWLGRRAPAGSQVVGIDAWINRRLLGHLVTDAATASRSGALDLEGRSWSDEALGLWGLERAAMPEVVDCAGPLGTTDAFGPALDVCGLIVDQQAALIGEGCLRAGQAKCTYGTGAFLLATAGEVAVRSTAGLSASVAWQLPGGSASWCLDGQVYAAGSALGWLERMGLLRSADELDAALVRADAASTVTCVPAFAGLGAPDWAPRAATSFEGIHLGTGPDELVAALVEGLCAQVALLARAVESDLGQPLEVLRVDGGLTRSTELLQRQADLLGRPLEVYGSPHATAIGLAALGRVGASAHAALDPGAPGPTRRFEPTISADEAEGRLARQRAAVRRAIEAAS